MVVAVHTFNTPGHWQFQVAPLILCYVAVHFTLEPTVYLNIKLSVQCGEEACQSVPTKLIELRYPATPSWTGLHLQEFFLAAAATAPPSLPGIDI